MKIKHYLYNCFTIEEGNTRIAIDPGIHMKLFHMRSLIPETEWDCFTHVFVTHGDPDHYAKADLIASASGAPIICGGGLTRQIENSTFLVHPRKSGLKSWIEYENVFPMDEGDLLELNSVPIEALKTQHGRIFVKLLGRKIEKTPGPNERTGLGSMGFKITIKGKTIVNLGDSLLQEGWADMAPDVLMLPIGGPGNNTWTMDVSDAVKAVQIIQPELVIPCHYNVPFLIIRNAAPADEHDFKRRIESLGIACELMYDGDSISI